MSLVIDGIDYEDLHARIHAAIDASWTGHPASTAAADRRRIDRDLAGLRDHAGNHVCGMLTQRIGCPDAARYAEDMRDVARLYGVTERHTCTGLTCGSDL